MLYEVHISQSGLTGNTDSYITLGIEYDDSTSGLDITDGDIVLLSSQPINIFRNLGFERSTSMRKLVMAANEADVTAGEINILVKLHRL